ncbi:glycosyl transferase [Helicobacter sp. MIT 11-5569]|uniref:capsular polysaccharide synthesis protein n=1 Tax=Helicobacter sp. MIT 11-5569 TaxID=1548151 RepID=UPI00051FB8AC|nr:capsular polysaccharide synthesis protein [Helicobacter sp. MIT 11-5569]TLD82669.1 glycosyl transferase [Helicobacter sp. MIT 11-5569]
MCKLLYALAELIPIKSLRRSLKAKKEAMAQSQVAKYLNAHYVESYFENKLQKWDFTPKVDFKGQKIIWQLWFQGEEQAPEIVKACFASVRKHMGDTHKIIILDENSIKDYIDFPPFVAEKMQNKEFTKTFFSDLLRVALLSTYGGIWLDATIFLSGRIPQEICEKDFFAPIRSPNAPKDYKRWINFNYRYFCWDKDFMVKFCSSFMVGKANNPMVVALRDTMLQYWENENILRHYFVFQILFELVNAHFRISFEGQNDTEIHLLQLFAKSSYDAALWDSIKEKSSVHKLTYHKSLKDSMVDNIVLRGKS